METKGLGSTVWTDLTVDDAAEVRDFYQEVTGWTASPVSMGEYDDFNMLGTDGQPAAGICHARGPNANLQAQWMV